MKTKEVEDVLGGADSWKNVDKSEGMSIFRLFCMQRLEEKHADQGFHDSQLCKREMRWPRGVLSPGPDPQC